MGRQTLVLLSYIHVYIYVTPSLQTLEHFLGHTVCADIIGNNSTWTPWGRNYYSALFKDEIVEPSRKYHNRNSRSSSCRCYF